mmetsp:Transcript_409/g.733  ORF Transcript_409/g.733 Transcript_409/m.733 type:complete len:326 (+) Transcript_409:378-1355(+)
MELDQDIDLGPDCGHVVVVPGEVVTRGAGFLRGHGTYVEDIKDEEEEDDEAPVEEMEEGDSRKPVQLVASVAGVVLRVNKLISVQPMYSRFSGEVGDIVIGRVVEVGNKQWRVDLGARQNGTLMLGSINLPGGALRRRTLEDQLQMRSLFSENDLISAEVSSFYQHGGMAIHTRSMRYGKLENGQLLQVPASLIKRVKQHFVSFDCGVDAIFGLNGRIWLTCARDDTEDMDKEEEEEDVNNVARTRMTELMEKENKIHALRKIDSETRLNISRVRNAIMLLSDRQMLIFPQSVMDVYKRSVALGLEPRAMLNPEACHKLFPSGAA